MTDAPIIASPDDIDLQFANRAFSGTSHTPEDRGYLYRDDYANTVNGTYADLWPLAKSEEQKALLATEMERFKQGALSRMKAYLASHANVVSAYIAGPSNFPTARMQKRGRWADNKRNEYVEYVKAGKQAIKKKILDARSPDEKEASEWSALERDFARSLYVVKQIDQDGSPYTRSAFTNSIAGKIERLAHNGEVALVERSLAWLTEHNMDSGKPAFTNRHKVWMFGQLAKEAEQRLTSRSGKPRDLLAEAHDIELWADYDQDRAMLIFPGKPTHELREQLKRSGWRWSPTNEAWQRQLTDNAIHAGKAFLAGLSPPRETGTSLSL